MYKLRTLGLAAACAAALFGAGAAQAATITVTMHLATDTGPGKEMGTVEFEDTDQGLLITPRLMRLHEGMHGFHVTETANCAPGKKNGETVPALAAGQPLTAGTATQQAASEEQGRLGDLPGLYVHYDGAAYNKTVKPQLKTSDLVGHAIVIDALGPQYRDAPKPRGGDILRVACGVVMR
jgi:Cu-Zn family superoxide dismutase